MSAWDSADLLALFNEYAGRPTTDAVSDTAKYAKLARSQRFVVAELAAVFPEALYPKVGYGSIPTLATTDNQVFTFGTDGNGDAIAPLGRTLIYPSLEAIPDGPWTLGVDYLWETTQIRIPNNQSWSGALYWRGVTTPTDISASQQPALDPPAARELIVIDAVRRWAMAYARNIPLKQLMDEEWDRSWAKWTLAWRTGYGSGGALIAFTGKQLAIIGQ